MSLTVSEGTSGAYTAAEAGTFSARCVALIDKGTQKSVYEGEEKSARKILFSFEITDPDNRRDDGSPHIIHKTLTASNHPKAAMRKLLETWRGKPFSAEELRAFDLKVLLGLNCLVGIVHTEKGDRTYANLSSVMKLPKGMVPGVGTEPLVSFDLDSPDWQVFAKLGSRLQAQIAESPEYAKANPPAHVQIGVAAVTQQAPVQRSASPAPKQAMPEFAPHSAVPAGASSGFDDCDSDIPF